MLPIPILDNLRCRSISYMMLILIALNVFAYIFKMAAIVNGNGEWFMQTFSLIPANFTNAFASGDPAAIGMALLSLLLAAFTHGNLSHIFGNMVFLFAFGRAVEARLGHWRFLGFYMLFALAAHIMQWFSDPMSTTSVVGASGAIAGVLSAYLVFFPAARIRGLLTPVPFPVTMRAVWFLGGWIMFQLLPVLPLLMAGKMSMSGGGVAYWEHIGGFAAGAALAFFVKLRQPQSDVCYVEDDCKPCEETPTEEEPK
jgi:membrane associated rhomboid family serine protease